MNKKKKIVWTIVGVIVVIFIVVLIVMMHGGQVSQQCTYSSPTAGLTATVYTTVGHIRVDSTVKQNYGGQSFVYTSHTIVDGQTVYTWVNNSKQGFETTATGTNISSIPGLSLGGIISSVPGYACSPWTVDQSKFTLPSGVIFSNNPSSLMGF